MAHDEELAERIRSLLEGTPGLTEKKMFGGIGFMVDRHMAAAANSAGNMMVRVDPDQGADWVDGADVTPMEMRGRVMNGWLSVLAGAVASDDELQMWLDRGVAYVRNLPPT